ncbi:MAG: hypothetical protein ACR2MA_13445 [Egibacteraceae bacterium]
MNDGSTRTNGSTEEHLARLQESSRRDRIDKLTEVRFRILEGTMGFLQTLTDDGESDALAHLEQDRIPGLNELVGAFWRVEHLLYVDEHEDETLEAWRTMLDADAERGGASS